MKKMLNRPTRIYYVVDHFRQTVLGLPQIPLDDGEALLRLFDVPHTYLVSPSLIPRPEDWSTQIGNWQS